MIAGISGQEGAFEEFYYEDMKYEQRIKLERINGVYIPANVGEAIEQFMKLTSADSRTKFKDMPEDSVAYKLRFSLGTWMIRNWGFYLGTRLSHTLNEKGISHPDDMADFLITVIHRSLNDRPLEAKQLIIAIREKRKQEYLIKMEEGELLETLKINKTDTIRVDR